MITNHREWGRLFKGDVTFPGNVLRMRGWPFLPWPSKLFCIIRRTQIVFNVWNQLFYAELHFPVLKLNLIATYLSRNSWFAFLSTVFWTIFAFPSQTTFQYFLFDQQMHMRNCCLRLCVGTNAHRIEHNIGWIMNECDCWSACALSNMHQSKTHLSCTTWRK